MNINDMVGKTFKTIVQSSSDELIFITDDGWAFKFFHSQSCCENVYIEDVCGDLEDLVNSPMLQADEESNSGEGERPYEYCDSWTWTFYKFATIKGSVTLRWLGTSNGYYSESVDLLITDPAGKSERVW